MLEVGLCRFLFSLIFLENSFLTEQLYNWFMGSLPENWMLIYDFDDSKPESFGAVSRLYRNMVTGAEIVVNQHYFPSGDSYEYSIKTNKIDTGVNYIREEGLTSKNKAISKANDFMKENTLLGGRVSEKVDVAYRAESERDAIVGVKETSSFSDFEWVLVAGSPKLGGDGTEYLLEELVEIVNEKGDSKIGGYDYRTGDWKIVKPEEIKKGVEYSREVDLDEEVIY